MCKTAQLGILIEKYSVYLRNYGQASLTISEGKDTRKAKFSELLNQTVAHTMATRMI